MLMFENTMNDLPTVDAKAAAFGYIQAYCGWHIAPIETHTIRLDALTGSHLALPTKKLVELVKVTLAGRDVTTACESSVSGVVRLRSGFGDRLGDIEVTFKHGFDWVEVPSLVAVLEQVAKRSATVSAPFRRQVVGPYQVENFSRGGAPLFGNLSLLDDEKKLLDVYRITHGV